MRRRRLLAVALFAVLAVTAGCVGMGDDLDEEALAEDADYDWTTDATGTITVDGEQYRAVYNVTNGSAVEVFHRDALGSEQVVQVSAVQFRYPNGTVVGADAVNVTVEDSRAVVRPPAERGKLAYSAPATPKSVTVPVTVPGSYEVVMPPDMRVSNFLFGDVRPRGYDTEIVDDQLHVRWDDLSEGTIAVRAYLARDLYVFGGIVAVLAAVGIGGVLYYRLQIKRLEERREEAGLNVDVDHDDDSGGPPLQ